jgi:hypothetical protein
MVMTFKTSYLWSSGTREKRAKIVRKSEQENFQGWPRPNGSSWREVPNAAEPPAAPAGGRSFLKVFEVVFDKVSVEAKRLENVAIESTGFHTKRF